MALSSKERAVLDFERTWWTTPDRPTKHEAIRTDLAISPTRYYALLEELADSAEACAYDPLVVHRLRRRRLARRRAQFTGEAPRRTRPH